MKHQLEYRHFRYFLAVAEELHFRKAAERLFISQPGLSRQIKQTEEELGIKLFERHNRKVKLTKAGIYLKKELKKHFNNLEDIISHAKQTAAGIEGSLEFRAKYPNIVFNLREMDNKMQIKALLNQEIDIGFVRMEKVPHGLEIKPVFEDTFSLVLPKTHKIDKSNFKDLSQLKNESFILFKGSFSESYYEKVMQIFDNCGFSPIISHYTVNASSIFRLVENNFGVSIVPTSLKLGYDMNIKFVELRHILQRTTLRIVRNNMNTSPVLENFLKLL